jgi:hypothetical protein
MRHIAKAAAEGGTLDEIISLIIEANEKNTQFDVPKQTGSFLVYLLHFDGKKRTMDGYYFLGLLLDRFEKEGITISERYHDILIQSPRLRQNQREIINTISVLNRSSSLTLGKEGEGRDAILPSAITNLEQHLRAVQTEKINHRYVTDMTTFEMETREVVRNLIWKLIIEYT